MLINHSILFGFTYLTRPSLIFILRAQSYVRVGNINFLKFCKLKSALTLLAWIRLNATAIWFNTAERNLFNFRYNLLQISSFRLWAYLDWLVQLVSTFWSFLPTIIVAVMTFSSKYILPSLITSSSIKKPNQIAQIPAALQSYFPTNEHEGCQCSQSKVCFGPMGSFLSWLHCCFQCQFPASQSSEFIGHFFL